MERDSARGEIQPGLKILARFVQTLELFQQFFYDKRIFSKSRTQLK